MLKIEIRLNSRKIASVRQFERELGRSIEKHVHDRIRKVAGPGVRLKKTRDGYVLEGAPDQIERTKKKLHRYGRL